MPTISKKLKGRKNIPRKKINKIKPTVIVVLEDVPHGPDGHRVGVLGPLSVVVVKALGVSRVAVAAGEVHGHHEVQPQPAADVV